MGKEWNTMPMMLQARHYATAVGIDNDFFVCGGDNGQQPLKSVETYDPNTKAWREMAPMLQERYGAASAAVKGNIYVCGGRSAFRVQNCLRTAERYSPENGWEPLPPMLQPRFRAAASVVDDDLFLLGGTNMHQSLSSVEQFDQLTNIWATVVLCWSSSSCLVHRVSRGKFARNASEAVRRHRCERCRLSLHLRGARWEQVRGDRRKLRPSTQVVEGSVSHGSESRGRSRRFCCLEFATPRAG